MLVSYLVLIVSSQRQLRLGLVLLVGWLVSPCTIFPENRPKDFSDFLPESTSVEVRPGIVG